MVLAHVGAPAPPAAAGDVEVTWTDSSEGVAVNGTYTPVVGDFLGGPAGQLDDIIWYAPGPTAERLFRVISLT